MFDRRLFALLTPVLGAVAIVATHPEPYSGWALWALFPLVVILGCLVASHRPPTAVSTLAASALALIYPVVFALAAGLGDESYTDVAVVVYLLLPLAGLTAAIVLTVCVAVTFGVRALRPSRSSAVHERPAVSLSSGALVAIAMFAVWLAAASLTRPQVVTASPGGRVPLVAHLRCQGDDTYLLTPVVRTQADGVHLVLENSSRHEVEVDYTIDDGAGGGGGQAVPPGVSNAVIAFKARTIGVACLDERPHPSRHATITVHDPLELAREPQLDCTGTSTEQEVRAPRSTSNLVAATKRYFRRTALLRPTDAVKRATGPDLEFPVVLVLRGDRAIAMLSFTAVDTTRYRATYATVCADA